MENLTESSGLRKIIAVEQYNRQSRDEGKTPGLIARIVRFFTAGPGKSPQIKDLDKEIVMELEIGTEVPLKRSEWGKHRVLVIDERIRLLELPGIEASSYGKEALLSFDLTIAYRVAETEIVAFEIEDPLRQLQEDVIHRVRDYARNYRPEDIIESDMARHLKDVLNESPLHGIRVERVKGKVILPEHLIDLLYRVKEAKARAEKLKTELNIDAEVEKLRDVISLEASRRENIDKQQLADLNREYEAKVELDVLDIKEKTLIKELEQRDLEKYNARQSEKDDEIHRLDLDDLSFQHFSNRLTEAGFPKQLIILMMEGKEWKLLFENIRSLIQADQSYRKAKIQAHYAVLETILKKPLSDETIQELIEWVQEESILLGGLPSPFEQISALSSNFQSTNTLEEGEKDEEIPTPSKPKPIQEYEYGPKTEFEDNNSYREKDNEDNEINTNNDEQTQVENNSNDDVDS